MQKTLMESRGISTGHQHYWMQPVYLQARDWFLSSFPLLGAVASAFRIVDSGDVVSRLNIPVAAVSPQLGEIYINPRCRLNLEEWKFVLAHEFLHAALRHDLRCEDRIPELWNVACDYVVNDWLCEMKVGCMPESALFDNQFHGMSAEAVYDQICENIRQYLKENPGDLLYGDGSEAADLNGSKLDSVYRSALQQGLVYHTQQNRGYLPVGLIEEIHALSRHPFRGMWNWENGLMKTLRSWKSIVPMRDSVGGRVPLRIFHALHGGWKSTRKNSRHLRCCWTPPVPCPVDCWQQHLAQSQVIVKPEMCRRSG